MPTGIVGARGFIGSYLSRYLGARHSGQLRLLLRSLANCEGLEGHELCGGDLQSRTDCERFAADLKVIYYLAHVNTPVNSDLDPPNDAMANLVPLLNLLDAIRRLRTKPHVVYFSSGGAIYTSRPNRIPFRESDPCLPLSSYGIQKLAAEHYLRLAAHKGDLTATVLRVGNAYGTLLSPYRMQGLIGVALNSVLQGRPVRVFGNPNNVRDYVHLEDICAIAMRAAAAPSEFSIANVGSGAGYSVAEVLDLIAACNGKAVEIQSDESCGSWLTDWVVLDTTRARLEFGWEPVIDLRSGIAGMIAGWRHEPRLDAAIV
jgi:UDP-glucose 4-epimerase